MWFFFKKKPPHPTKKFILFDFDGTLADTLEAVVDILNSHSKEFKIRKITTEDLDRLRDMPPLDILKEFKVSLMSVTYIATRCKMMLNSHIEDIPVIPGIKKLLARLKKERYKMGIMTSNSEGNVRRFLKKNGLLKYFNVLHSGISAFGKTLVINSFLHKVKLSPEDVVYLGDEIRDIESAKKSRVPMVAVGWGFNSKKALLSHKPDHFISRPMQLMKVLKGKKTIRKFPRFFIRKSKRS